MKTFIHKKDGTIESFDGIPDGAYAAVGLNGSKTGNVYKMINDQGTCLVPVVRKSGRQVNVGRHFAGLVYNKRTKLWEKQT